MRVAIEAARFLIDGTEHEYLQAKERALMACGFGDQTRLPSNKLVREMMSRMMTCELGEDEINRRLKQMREIAAEIMTIIEDFDPFLIGSVLAGNIRETSDIDLHAYAENHEEIECRLRDSGYEDIYAEIVHNRKGEFVHLRWEELGHPVEITVYPWSWRDTVMLSSVTGKPIKRADPRQVRHLVNSLKHPANSP